MLAAALIAGAALLPLRGGAQQASVPPQLAGTWVPARDPNQAARTVEAAFAPSIAALPELFQGFARDRIRNDMSPPRRVIVGLEGGAVQVTFDATRRMTIEGRLNAAARTVGVDDGTRVTPRLTGGWLELAYEGEGSVMRQLLSTEADGSAMHLDYTVVNPRLVAPVRYRLEYRRAP